MSDNTPTLTPISEFERLEYITTNEQNLTQLAIQNKQQLGTGALFINLDDPQALKDRNIKVMYLTAGYLATNAQFKDIVDILTSAKAKECVYFLYNDGHGISKLLEKQLN